MLENVKKLLALLRLYREVKSVDSHAELDGLKRLGKGLLAAAIVAGLRLTAEQAGPDCLLGETACKALQDPLFANLLMAGLLGAEKYLNEKFGLGIQALNTGNR